MDSNAAENLMRKQALEKRTVDFAVSVFSFLDSLPLSVSSRVISFQLGKSASSVGANYHEANRAESRSDFAHKIGIVLKESSETEYWLKLLSHMYPTDNRIKELHRESVELVSIFQSTHRTLRTNSQSKS